MGSSGLTLRGTSCFQERTRTKQVFKNKDKIIINKGQESQFSQNVGGPGALGRGLSGNVGHDDCFDICSFFFTVLCPFTILCKRKEREKRLRLGKMILDGMVTLLDICPNCQLISSLTKNIADWLLAAEHLYERKPCY